MFPLIIEHHPLGRALLTGLIGALGEPAARVTVGDHPLAFAGALLVIYCLLAPLRRNLSRGLRHSRLGARVGR